MLVLHSKGSGLESEVGKFVSREVMVLTTKKGSLPGDDVRKPWSLKLIRSCKIEPYTNFRRSIIGIER